MKDLTELSANQQAQIFTQFVLDLKETNRKSGTIYGTVQILGTIGTFNNTLSEMGVKKNGRK